MKKQDDKDTSGPPCERIRRSALIAHLRRQIELGQMDNPARLRLALDKMVEQVIGDK